MSDPTMATVLDHDGKVGLRYERRLRHPPEKVWRAITESEHLQHWLPCDIVGERRAGAPIELPFWPAQVEAYDIDTPVLHGEIVTWDPPRRFEWMWDTDRLRWELEPDGDGTKLTFTTILGDSSMAPPADTAAGYHVCLDHLVALVDGVPIGPLVDADVSELNGRYAELVAQSAP